MALAIRAEAVKLKTGLLLQAPMTLKSSGARVWAPVASPAGSSDHVRLFSQYRDRIVRTATMALDWWDDTVDVQRVDGRTEKEAVRAAFECRPAGPASFPEIVALIRKFWLDCDELNQRVSEDERVPPWIFILAWLRDAGHDEAVSVLACMPYWPIGLDEDGNWV
jgi:hypothetical protein